MEFKLKEKYKTEKEKIEAIQKDRYNIQYIKNPSEKIQLMAIVTDEFGNTIKFIENPSEKVQLKAIKDDPENILFIKNPSEKVKLEAVKQNGWTIKYIENPSKKIQLAAVKQNGYSIKYIKNPSEEVQLEAIKEKTTFVIQYIENPSEKVQLEAVKCNPLIIANKNIIMTDKLINTAVSTALSEKTINKKEFKYILAARNIDWDKISDETKLLIEML